MGGKMTFLFTQKMTASNLSVKDVEKSLRTVKQFLDNWQQLIYLMSKQSSFTNV
jgi:hypothetical protein